MNNRISVLIVCAGSLLLSGCAKYYKPKPLSMPQVVGQEKDGLLVQATSLSARDCNYVFNNCSPRAKNYEVVQLAVTNKAHDAYVLNAKNISLPLASVPHVAQQVGFSVAGRVALWSALGIPASAYLLAVSLCCSNPALVVLACGYAGSYAALSAIDVADVRRANKDIIDDFVERAISCDSNIVIEPQKIMNRVMFINKKDYTPFFDLGLVNQATDEMVTFTVDLK